jgi:hypothetical protein
MATNFVDDLKVKGKTVASVDDIETIAESKAAAAAQAYISNNTTLISGISMGTLPPIDLDAPISELANRMNVAISVFNTKLEQLNNKRVLNNS